MHPELFHIGDITIFSYGFLIAIGALLGYWYTAHQCRKQFGLSHDKIQTLIVLVIIASVAGGKLFIVFEDPQRYLADFSLLFKNFESGFVFYGSLIFATPTVYFFILYHKLPMFPMLDVIAGTTCIVHGMGRLGCFFAGCCYGVPTDSWVGVNFVAGNQIDMALHPTQLYEVVLVGGIFLFLMYKKRKQNFNGQLFITYLFLYASGRGIIEYFRGDEARGYVLDGVLSNSQFISIILLFMAIMGYFYLKNRRDLQIERK